MCGIFFHIDYNSKTPNKFILRTGEKVDIYHYFKLMKHRGPDMSNFIYFPDEIDYVAMGFHRLAIRGLGYSGMQPFYSERTGRKLFCMVNGEIYNTHSLWNMIAPSEDEPVSDCEVVLRLFEYTNFNTKDVCNQLRGYFAFVIYEQGSKDTSPKLYIGTDEMSIRPLFIGVDKNSMTVASEMQSIPEKYGSSIIRIKPGHICTPFSGLKRISTCVNDLEKNQHPYFFWTVEKRNWDMFDIGKWVEHLTDVISRKKELFNTVATKVHGILVESVMEQLESDREMGFLLSGGLDSSLVCSIASKGSSTPIKTFTVGILEDFQMEDVRNGTLNVSDLPSDIIAARKVAEHIGSDHHEYFFSMSEALDTILEVIKILGSWDQTTVRASIPMYLCVKRMKEEYPDIAVVFSGEVSDEMFQGYIYFRKFPTPEESRSDSIRLMKNICHYDALRADRIISSMGMELRLPFFDKRLLNVILGCNPSYLHPGSNNGIEKHLLREAFRKDGYLPECILDRAKGTLSDESSKNSSLKFNIKRNLHKILPYTPNATEDEVYALIFDVWYGIQRRPIIPGKWMPMLCPEVGDDSSASAIKFEPKIEVIVEE